MTGPTLRVLRVLLDTFDQHGEAEHYGLELAKAASLPSGTIYPILARLERYGLLAAAWENIDEHAEGRRRRRYYTLTGEGARAARAELAPLAPAPRAALRPGLA